MPLYEYACGACGAISEISHRLSEPSPTDCPKCGKSALSKQISAAGFRLKGEGWYETDFKSKNKRNLAGDTAPADKGGGESASKSTESKPSSGGGKASGASDSAASSKPASSSGASTPS